MRINSASRTGTYRSPIALLALASRPGIAATQDEFAGATPLNAHLKRHGSGWECDRGYRPDRRSCVSVEVPPNAYLDSSGHDWDCERGFRKGLRSCLAFPVPTNGHVGYSGKSWTGAVGYRQRGETCTEDKR
jgi:hypothetical protein